MNICHLFLLAVVDNLTAKVKAWEAEKGIPFLYDKVTYHLVYFSSEFIVVVVPTLISNFRFPS